MKSELIGYITGLINIKQRELDYCKADNDDRFYIHDNIKNDLTDLLTFVEDLQEEVENTEGNLSYNSLVHRNARLNLLIAEKDSRIKELENNRMQLQDRQPLNLKIAELETEAEQLEAKYENCRNIASGRIGGYKNTITQKQIIIIKKKAGSSLSSKVLPGIIHPPRILLYIPASVW